jgi:hypothetical protein
MRHFWYGVGSLRKQWRIKMSLGETSFIIARPRTKPTLFLWSKSPQQDSNPQQASGRRPSGIAVSYSCSRCLLWSGNAMSLTAGVYFTVGRNSGLRILPVRNVRAPCFVETSGNTNLATRLMFQKFRIVSSSAVEVSNVERSE